MPDWSVTPDWYSEQLFNSMRHAIKALYPEARIPETEMPKADSVERLALQYLAANFPEQVRDAMTLARETIRPERDGQTAREYLAAINAGRPIITNGSATFVLQSVAEEAVEAALSKARGKP